MKVIHPMKSNSVTALCVVDVNILKSSESQWIA
jgi:hypothetical protein